MRRARQSRSGPIDERIVAPFVVGNDNGIRSGRLFLRFGSGAGVLECGFPFEFRKVEFLENLTVVFAEQRRRKPIENGVRFRTNGIGDTASRFERRMLDFDDQTTRDGLRIVESFADGLDGRCRDVRSAKALKPGAGGKGLEMMLQEGNEVVAMDDAVGVRKESRIGTELRFEIE